MTEFASSSDCHLKIECELKREIGIPCEHTLLIKPSTKMKLAFTQCKNCLGDRNLIVDFLALSFGCAAWMGVNSIYLQLPLLVGPSPEQWNLPSYLVVVIQIANLGPILYSLIQKLMPGRFKDSSFIYALLIIGCIASILMAFLYDKTSEIFGAEHSTSMLSLAFFLALVGCTSSVLFMPHMGRFREIYLISYLMGEGVGGFLPSIVALIQGAGGNPECIETNTTTGEIVYEEYYPPPRFGSLEFFIFVFIMYLLSTLAFTLLNTLQICKKECVDRDHQRSLENDEPAYKISRFNYYLILVLMGIICFMANGVFPSVMSYSALPYGNRAYHLTVTLSTIANPLACFFAVFLPHKSVRDIVILAIVTAFIACYALATSLLSPAPPLLGLISGEMLVVLCWTFLMGLVSYVKLSIIAILRLVGGRSLFVVGAVQQLGSALGALMIFFILSFTTLFKQYKHCA